MKNIYKSVEMEFNPFEMEDVMTSSIDPSLDSNDNLGSVNDFNNNDLLIK